MLINQIKQFITTHQLIKPHDTLIVGLSGGPDSVFLLTFLKQLERELNLTLIAAHLNHEWRPESYQDALFSLQLAEQLQIAFVTAKASEIQLQKKAPKSKEALGRLWRRQFFELIAQKYQADSIVLAHHANDQQETFFLRLLRGTTVTGLASMQPKQGLYIRPLLGISKDAILEYLRANQINYREDSTNAQIIFLRNNIRHTVIPALKSCDSRFDKNFSKMLEHIQQTEAFLDHLTHSTFKLITENSPDNLTLLLDKFFECDSFLQQRLIMLWLCSAKVHFRPSTSLLQEIIRFLALPGLGNHRLYGAWTIRKHKQKAFIKKH